MTTIRLVEYQESEWELAASDAAFIAGSLGQQIGITRTLTGDRYRLNPRQFVGIVQLPSGRRLESAPKVPVGTLFTMLAVAFEFGSPFRDEVTGLDRLDDLLEFIVAHFAELVEERIARGLYRDYIETEANLGVVRGRIAIAEDLRQNVVSRHRTYCRFTEFTWDIPENQIIRQVIHALSAWDFRPSLRFQLRRLDSLFGEVTSTSLPPSILDRITYHRLNEEYRPIHKLCRLFLQGASLSEDEGIIDFRTFLIDMNRLFEAFVTQLFRERAPTGITVDGQARVYLGQERNVPMRLDILLLDRGTPLLVADCKYKRVVGGDVGGHDVYQVLAYCTATRVTEGVLIYPEQEASSDDQIAIRHTDVRIRTLAIDLNRQGAAFETECQRLVDRATSSVVRQHEGVR